MGWACSLSLFFSRLPRLSVLGIGSLGSQLLPLSRSRSATVPPQKRGRVRPRSLVLATTPQPKSRSSPFIEFDARYPAWIFVADHSTSHPLQSRSSMPVRCEDRLSARFCSPSALPLVICPAQERQPSCPQGVSKIRIRRNSRDRTRSRVGFAL